MSLGGIPHYGSGSDRASRALTPIYSLSRPLPYPASSRTPVEGSLSLGAPSSTSAVTNFRFCFLAWAKIVALLWITCVSMTDLTLDMMGSWLLFNLEKLQRMLRYMFVSGDEKWTSIGVWRSLSSFEALFASPSWIFVYNRECMRVPRCLIGSVSERVKAQLLAPISTRSFVP